MDCFALRRGAGRRAAFFTRSPESQGQGPKLIGMVLLAALGVKDCILGRRELLLDAVNLVGNFPIERDRDSSPLKLNLDFARP